MADHDLRDGCYCFLDVASLSGIIMFRISYRVRSARNREHLKGRMFNTQSEAEYYWNSPEAIEEREQYKRRHEYGIDERVGFKWDRIKELR